VEDLEVFKILKNMEYLPHRCSRKDLEQSATVEISCSSDYW